MPGATCTATCTTVTDYCTYRILFRVCLSFSHTVYASTRDLPGYPSRASHLHGHPPGASTPSTRPTTHSGIEAATPLSFPDHVTLLTARPPYPYYSGSDHRPTSPVLGPASIFSQWYPSPFTIDNELYNCAEQYMMSGKAKRFGDTATRRTSCPPRTLRDRNTSDASVSNSTKIFLGTASLGRRIQRQPRQGFCPSLAQTTYRHR